MEDFETICVHPPVPRELWLGGIVTGVAVISECVAGLMVKVNSAANNVATSGVHEAAYHVSGATTLAEVGAVVGLIGATLATHGFSRFRQRRGV